MAGSSVNAGGLISVSGSKASREGCRRGGEGSHFGSIVLMQPLRAGAACWTLSDCAVLKMGVFVLEVI